MRIDLPSGRSLDLFIRHDSPKAGESLSIPHPSGDPGLVVRGLTVATVKVDGQEFTGPAACSAGDVFSRHRGVQVAVARALKKAGVAKGDRKAVWAKVFSNKYGR